MTRDLDRDDYLAKAREAAHNAEMYRDDAEANYHLFQEAGRGTAAEYDRHKQMSHARQMMAAEAALASAYALLAEVDFLQAIEERF